MACRFGFMRLSLAAVVLTMGALAASPVAFAALASRRASARAFARRDPQAQATSGTVLHVAQGTPSPGADGVLPRAALLCLSSALVAAAGAAGRRGSRGWRGWALRAAEDEATTEEWRGADEFSKLTEVVPLVFDNVAVSKILPHRYPFLLVDKVVAFEAGKRAVGVKNVSANESQFTGHFPDRPIMPGVLMVEAMAQLGGVVCLQQPVSDGQGEFFFAGIDGIKFRRPVVPGDTLVMEMKLKKWRAKYGIAKMTGRAYVDGQLALEVKEFTFALVQEAFEC